MKILRNIFYTFLGVALGVAILFGLFALGKAVFPARQVSSPACPDCICGNTGTDVVVQPEPEVTTVTSDYSCNAVQIGGPISTAGSCTYCTVNYSKPGDVYIAGSEPISYDIGAWVWQYQNLEVDDAAFKACILAQPMYTNPELGYNPVPNY